MYLVQNLDPSSLDSSNPINVAINISLPLNIED